MHTRSTYSALRLFTWIINVYGGMKLRKANRPVLFDHRRVNRVLSVPFRIDSNRTIFQSRLDEIHRVSIESTIDANHSRFLLFNRTCDTCTFREDKDRRVHTTSRSLPALSSLESSETVTIILYNRYNSNASYGTVYATQREEGNRIEKRGVSIRKTLFTVASIK